MTDSMRLLAVTTACMAGLRTAAGVEPAVPSPLTMADGREVSSAEAWRSIRRPEILELFRKHVYGRTPGKPFTFKASLDETNGEALGGKAVRKQLALDIACEGRRLTIHVLVYLPSASARRPVPLFALLNFGGNHTTQADDGIELPRHRAEKEDPGAEVRRGAKAASYPIEDICARGYGIATAHCADIDPDRHDGFADGAHGLLDGPEGRKEDAWGAIAAWAWGLSRMMDYFETDADIDHARVAVLGHSRLGKAALWAGAQDERFSIVISNNSGCTGAAVSRRRAGETIKDINGRFPHWFCENYRRYNGREDDLPVDQHMLLAVMAPRPVYVASASLDQWADPEGEFLSCVLASPVYDLLGFKGIGGDTMPAADTPLMTGRIGYHLRSGKHALAAYDWKCYMDFADIHWKHGNGQ